MHRYGSKKQIKNSGVHMQDTIIICLAIEELFDSLETLEKKCNFWGNLDPEIPCFKESDNSTTENIKDQH